MFNKLQDRLDKAFHILKGHGQITDVNIAETLKEIRRALLDADVSYKIAKSFTEKVKEKALGQKVISALNPSQLMTKIVHDELVKLMGGEQVGLSLSSPLSIVLIAGLQGSGKTTFSAKLANFLKNKKNKKPLLVAADVYRPAAMEQLRILGEQINVKIHIETDNKNPLQIAENGREKAKNEGYDTLIIDTAGRLAVDSEMMDEISLLHQHLKPNETLFVVDAMTGQDAVNTAKAFNDRLNFDGVVLTKLDGDTRGGAALTIKSTVNKPIKFIGTGEKMEALDLFYPERMADRILGMGDVVSLVERVQEQFDQEQARRLQKKIAKNQFNFNDFLSQIQQIKKMGSMKDLLGMMPGVGKTLKNTEINEDAFKSVESIIYSMTPKERVHPEIIGTSRRKRIAKGAGQSLESVNKLMKQFSEMGKMMRFMQSTSGKKALQMIKQTKGQPKM